MLKEWPLVAFTVAGQAAVGMFLFAAVPRFFVSGIAADVTGHRTGLVVLAVVLGLLVAAALLSLFHLHHPFRARHVLANLRTSWLSRELFFQLGFMALVALGIHLALSRPPGNVILKGVLSAAGLAGILFLLSMSRLYMLQTVPLWNRAYTPLSFFMTSLSLGALAAALAASAGARKPSQAGPFVLLAFILVASEIAAAFYSAPGHGKYGFRPGPSLRPPAEAPRAIHLTRLVLLIAGLALIGAALAAGNSRSSGWPSQDIVLVAALALVLSGQVVGRFLFYGLLIRPGR